MKMLVLAPLAALLLPACAPDIPAAPWPEPVAYVTPYQIPFGPPQPYLHPYEPPGAVQPLNAAGTVQLVR